MVKNKYCRVCKTMISYFSTASQLHHCNHYIHYSCLSSLLLEYGTNKFGCVACCEDIFEADDPMAREHIKLNVTYQLALNMTKCSYCNFYIHIHDPCLEFRNCPHFMHSYCGLELIRREGITGNGHLLCKFC